MNPRPPLPPFTEETARQKVQAAEDAWNLRDPERVALAYTEDTEWRNRTEYLGNIHLIEIRPRFEQSRNPLLPVCFASLFERLPNQLAAHANSRIMVS